jgi:hypothetical protein
MWSVDRGSSPSSSGPRSGQSRRRRRGKPPDPPPSRHGPCSCTDTQLEAPAALPLHCAALTGTLLYRSPRTHRRSRSRSRQRGSGERGTKFHSRTAAAASTSLPGHITHSQARSLIDAGRNHPVKLKSGGILLNPVTTAAGAEKMGGQTIALKTLPSLLLYRSGRQLR